MIPSLLNTNFLYEDSDYTWIAVEPTLWLQISYNLSVITSCIPTIKSVFDSISGTLTGAMIDAPYDLTALPGRTGLTATVPDPRHSRRISCQCVTGFGGGPNLSPAIPNQATCYTTARVRSTKKTADQIGEYRSESMRHLTDGSVIVTENVHIDYESIGRDSYLEA